MLLTSLAFYLVSWLNPENSGGRYSKLPNAAVLLFIASRILTTNVKLFSLHINKAFAVVGFTPAFFWDKWGIEKPGESSRPTPAHVKTSTLEIFFKCYWLVTSILNCPSVTETLWLVLSRLYPVKLNVPLMVLPS